MAQSFVKCEICDERECALICLDCDQYFCQKCKEGHIKTKTTKHHQFLDSGTFQPQYKKLRCTQHEHHFIFFCERCETLVCPVCLPENHQEHRMLKIDKVASIKKKELNETLKIFVTKLNEFDSEVNSIQSITEKCKGENKDVIQHVDEQAKHISNVLENQRRCIIKSVKQKTKTEEKRISILLEDLQHCMKEAKELERKVKLDLLGSETSLLSNFQLRKSKLDTFEFNDTTISTCPVKFSKYNVPKEELSLLESIFSGNLCGLSEHEERNTLKSFMSKHDGIKEELQKELTNQNQIRDQQFRQQLNEKDKSISDLNQMINRLKDQEKKIKTIKKERDDLQLRQSEIIVDEKETEIQRLKNQIENLHGEKSDVLKRLCFLKDYAIQSKDQLHTTNDQKPKFTDDQSISEVLDIIQTNMTYIHKNLTMLEDTIHSKEDTVRMHCEKIKELQQKSNHFESEKNRISEEFKKVCKERDDLRNRPVLKDEILSEKEIIRTQENSQEVNILELQQHVQQLEADKDTLSEKYVRICTEMDNIRDGMVYKEKIIKTYLETIKEMHQQTQQLKTANDGIFEKYNQVCKERDELKNGSMTVDELHSKEENIKAQEKIIDDKIRDQQQVSQQLQTERDELVEKYGKVCKERDEIIDGNQSIQLAFENMERELKEKETEMHAKDQQFRQQLNEKDRDISDLNQMLNRHKGMVSDQEKNIRTIKKERDDLQLRSQSIQKVFDDYEKRIEKYQIIQAEKETEFQSKQQGFLHQLKQKDNSISEINRIMNQQNNMISNLEETIRGVRKEKDDLQTRLSSVAGEKLTKGNPSITDLGDPNRPMKIGKKYGELYDNEWTDAMENTIEAKKHYPDLKESEIEEIIIRHLHRLLKCCYIECILEAEEQIHKLGEALAETMCLTLKTKDEIASLSVIREALVLRRSKSEDFAKFLFENQVICNNTIADWDYVNKNENLMQILTQSTFFEKCIYLCWCMVIQDPVMHLDDDPVSNTPIDKNTYKEFAKSGDSVAYVVWPALFLHKGGPLLYKGVVQAYWKKDDDDNLEGTSV